MRIRGSAAAALLAVAPVRASLTTEPFQKESFVKSLYQSTVLSRLAETHRRQLSVSLQQAESLASPSFLNQHRRRFGHAGKELSEDGDGRTVLEQPPADQIRTCDVAFVECLKNDQCIKCFSSLQTEGIDWASVTPETPCKDVVTFLWNGGHCTYLQGDSASTDMFCNTFDSCVVWDDDNGSGGGGGTSGDNSTQVDCASLTECKWPGFHPSFIGDGVCHDGIGCYNTEICGFDAGDCCPDTCNSGNNQYLECGMDGYVCKDPASADCDPFFTNACPESDADDDFVDPNVDCASNQVPYRLVMYDSFGDGWDNTKLSLRENENPANLVFEGGLKDGSQGTELICLAMDPTCYHVDVSGGVWGNEVSWEIKPIGQGTRAVADGGSPMTCEFSVAGQVCVRTCEGKPNTDTSNDPDYKTYKEMYKCMESTCLIQVGACQDDPACAPCFSQDAAEFCFANDKFNAALDCGVCNCAGEEGKISEFCQHKATPGAVLPSPTKGGDADKPPRPCSAAETLQGSSAVITFAKCSDFDEVGMMMTDFDENNFGALDTFEACAHSYAKESLHGGRTALGCMQILANAMNDPADDAEDSNAPKDAISALAKLLYHNAEDFCECASKASAECPLCPSFHKFKTLLYESLDACNSLDEIDCDAWNEFYTPCKNNLVGMFGNVDFKDSKQCDYVKDTCGGAGPFPAFRKLDCNREIPKSAWDFYSLYSRSCMGNDEPPTPATPSPPSSTPAAPSSTPQPPTSPSGGSPAPDSPAPTPKPYNGGGKPYVPSGDSPNSATPAKKRSHRFLNFLILVGIVAGAAYWYHKRRSEFQFVRYRRARNYGGDDGDMYSGLSMESSTTFEPPTLPPTPSALEGGMT